MLEIRNRIYYVFILVVMFSTIGYELFQVGNITKRVIAPVQELTEKARTFEGHQISQAVCSIPQEVDDEMEHLLQVYNSMVLRIQKQMEEIQENASAKERLKNQELENLRINNRLKSSELKALQMQINPHFPVQYTEYDLADSIYGKCGRHGSTSGNHCKAAPVHSGQYG